MRDLSSEKKQFDLDGFVKVEQFFTSTEIEEIKQNVHRYQTEVTPKVDKRDKMSVHYDPTKFTLLGRMDLYDSFFKDLHQDERLMTLAEKLLGEPARLQHLQFFNIVPDYGGPTPPHQDAFNFLIDPSHALAVWIPLVDIDEMNGGLTYIPGSHLKGHRNHMRKFISTFIVDPYTAIDKEIEKPVYLKKGDVASHHCFTIHRSQPNRSQSERWALGAIYYSHLAQVMPSRQAWLSKYGSAQTAEV